MWVASFFEEKGDFGKLQTLNEMPTPAISGGAPIETFIK